MEYNVVHFVRRCRRGCRNCGIADGGLLGVAITSYTFSSKGAGIMVPRGPRLIKGLDSQAAMRQVNRRVRRVSVAIRTQLPTSPFPTNPRLLASHLSMPFQSVKNRR